MIVLDTHAFVWWAAGSSKLSAMARRSIDASARRGIPAIGLWEIAMLTERRGSAVEPRPILRLSSSWPRPWCTALHW